MVLRWHLSGILWLSVALNSGVYGTSEWQLLREDVQRLRQPASIAWGGATLGAALLAHPFDAQVQGPVNNAYVEPWLDAGNRYFDSVHVLSAAAVFRLAARRWGSEEIVKITSHGLRALVLANALVAPLKVVVRRERPDKSNHFSFPSGHSANAFALATVLSGRYGKAALPIYALASLVPAARIHERHHYPSDVIAGAGLGVLAGWVSSRSPQATRWALAPIFLEQGWGMRVHWQL